MPVAILPAAPLRFSTTTGFPHRSVSFCASCRARISTPPPGANPTSSRTGLAGYCAPAGSEAISSSAGSSARKSCFMGLSHYGGAAARRKVCASRRLPMDTTSLPKGIFSAHHCSSSWRARSMKLVVKVLVVLLVALLSAPALAGRGSSGGRSGGFGHSGAHFAGGRHFVPGGHFAPGGHFVPGSRIFVPGSHFISRSTTVFVGVGIPFYGYYPPPLPYYYDYPPAYYPLVAPPQQSYWYFCSSANAYYPYVQQCPEGWQAVAPVPPS